jgi:hypothetical protein
MNDAGSKTLGHLWIVGILSLVWNAIGAFDYSATEMRLDFYLSKFTPEQLAYVFAFPAWAVGAWALAVWSSVLGSVFLLLRLRMAVAAFAVAIAGMVVTGLYNFLLSDGLALMGKGALVFTGVIWVIAFFLFIYARTLAARGVLR